MEINNENLQNEKLLELRKNIIKWYDFQTDDKVLIVGDHTGAITEFLTKKVNEVTTVVKEKATECEHLLQIGMQFENVTIINNDFMSTELHTKFDKIILLEVFDFYEEDTQNVNVMKKAKQILKENGTILLSVSNPISLKFLSEWTNQNCLIKGISKPRLEKILEQANFPNYKFYYPLSDYHIANVIFTDELLPTNIDLERNMDLKKIIEKKKFDDRRVLAEVARHSQSDFKYYCNSFLVEITNQPIAGKAKAIYYNNIRKQEYRLVTKILEKEVAKYSADEASQQHLKNIAENIKILEYCNIHTLDRFDGEKIRSRYVKDSITLQNLFLAHFKAKRTVDLLRLVEKYKSEILLKLGKTGNEQNVFEKYGIAISQEKTHKMTFVKNGLYDLTFPNIFLIEDECYVYDQEWREENVPIEFILYRSIRYMPQISNEEKQELYQLLKVAEFEQEFVQLEEKLQEGILDKDLHEQCLNNFKSYDCMDDNQLKKFYELKEKEIEAYKKELSFKQGMLDSKEMMSAYLNTQVDDFSKAYFTVSNELVKMQKELEQKNEEVSSIYQSEQYQKGAIALKREKDLYPILVTVRGLKKITRKIFKPIKKGILLVIRKLGKKVYDLYPVKEHKRALKNKFLYSEKLARIGNVATYQQYCAEPIDMALMEDGTEELCVKFQVGLNKTIGIHLHLFYEDLLDEFYQYFCHIPYVFDLYVSVQKGANVKKITKKFNEILNLNQVKVVETPNSGRDFGPMFVEFREDLKQYDYVMHVHSKKSLRMGNEQSEWRKFMLDHLLGSTSTVMKCFYLMEQMNMGMVYVDCFKGAFPYWINTWLGEAPIARDILNRMGMEFKDEILQFPAGSMFWAKKEALKQLFDLPLTWDDFGYEDGNEDNNLAYVFERITGKVAKYNGYDLAIYNPYEKRFRINQGEQLLSEYYNQNKETVFSILCSYDIVTFDIFDTLLTRTIYNPDDSFEIIANRIKAKKIVVDDYFKTRKEAELNVRKAKNFEGDCDIHEIYEEFEKLTGLSKEDVETIKQTEIDTELELVIPRRDMLDLYNRLLQNGKRIILITDMYLTKEQLTKMLNKCGYDNWFELLVSSEIGCRKDNGTMWDYFFEKYPNCTTVHVGDNEYADIHALLKRGKAHFHVYKGTKLNTLMDCQYVEPNDHLNLLESVMFGSVINQVVCNSPFVMNNAENKSFIDNYYNYGYGVLGPIIFGYMRWLYKMAKENEKGEVLLFSAREGYYLQKIYNLFKEKLGDLPNVDDHYLYISRRAVTVMGIETIQDVRKIMETLYNGSLREVLYYRLNYKENNFVDEVISLPRDIDKVMRVVEANFDVILANAKSEKEKYLKYIDSLNIDFENKQVSVLDLGYAGTAQYYLAKLLNQKIDGKYFVVQSNLKPIQLGCDVYSCYNKDICNKSIDKNVIYKNSLLIESFLTSPDGQFLYMEIENGECKPRFLYEPRKNEQIRILDQVYEGVKDYTENVLNLMGQSIFDYEMDNKYIYLVYENALRQTSKFSDALKQMFFIEDYYCSNAVVNSFEVLSRRKKDFNRE